MLDVKAMADAATKAMKDYVARALAPILQRLDAMEARPIPKDGESVPVEQVERMVADAVHAAVSALPVPKDGISVSPEDVAAMVAESVASAVAKAAPPEPDPQLLESIVDIRLAEAVARLPVPKDGESVPVEHVAQMVDDAVERAFSAVPPPKDGESVPIEQVERMVAEAVTKALADRPAPKDGEPGRDAAHIEILPAIDETKAYPRGTFATHKGGLWRSFQTTDGMKGWECIVDGVAGIEIGQPTERHVIITVERASGAAEAHALDMPAVIYRGKWVAGRYLAGDMVTAKGGIWHCNLPTETEPGTDETAWTLAAKSGDRGASAYTIALRNGFKGSEAEWVKSLKGKQGEPGRPGRDLTQLGFDGGKH